MIHHQLASFLSTVAVIRKSSVLTNMWSMKPENTAFFFLQYLLKYSNMSLTLTLVGMLPSILTFLEFLQALSMLQGVAYAYIRTHRKIKNFHWKWEETSVETDGEHLLDPGLQIHCVPYPNVKLKKKKTKEGHMYRSGKDVLAIL